MNTFNFSSTIRLLMAFGFVGVSSPCSALTLFDASGNLQEIGTKSQKPVINTQPADWLGPPGGVAEFTVAVSSPTPVTYQWKKGTFKLPNTNSPTIGILDARSAIEDGYIVEVKNASGTVVSRAARLYVDSDGDGFADTLERKYFPDLGQSASDDSDSDGISNADELIDGTNPALNTSRFFRLATAGTGGVVNATPVSLTGRYAPGTKVKLNPVPESGQQFVGWEGTYQSLSPVLNLTMNQDVTVTAVFGSALGLALDAPQLRWETGGNGSWVGQRLVNHDARAAAASPKLIAQGQSFVSSYVEGPATVSFWWMQPTASSASMTFSVNGTLNATAVKGSWNQRTVTLNQGVHLLSWTLTQPSGTASNAQGWLDEVRVSTHAAIPLSQALEAPTFTFATDRMNPWYGTISSSQDGVDCAVGIVNGQYHSSWIETRVPGPGTLNFWWRTVGNGTGMRVYVDGTQKLNQDSSTWTNSTLTISGAGPHMVTWEVHTQDDAYAQVEYGVGHLDKLTWTPAQQTPVTVAFPAVTPTVALDQASFAWSTGGSKPWVPTSTSAETYDSVDAMKSGAIGHKAESWIETKFLGPGNVNFRWRVSSAPGDQLTVLVDGVMQRGIEGNVGYSAAVVSIPVGYHTVRWRYAKDAKDIAGNDSAYLDSVSFSITSAPSPAVPTLSGPAVPALATAVDHTTLLFATGGAQPFIVDSSTTHDSVDSASNGDIGNGQESWMETIISGTGTLKFWWKVSSEANYDYLRLLIDGVEQTKISGSVDWIQYAYVVASEGLHVVRWRYSKDNSTSSGADTGWVDQVTWTGASGGTGGGSEYAIAPTLLRMPPVGGTFPLVMIGNGAWTAVETAPWLMLSASSGAGNATLQATATEQTTAASRQTVADIAGRKVTIIQEGFQKPVIGALITEATLTVGNAFTASFAAYNYPTKFMASGLPPGLTIDASSGAISGNVAKAGLYTTKITASNPAGTGSAVNIKFTVLRPIFVDGIYTGLIPPNTLLNSDLGGLVTLTLSKTGAITGSLKMGAHSTPVIGGVVVTTGGGARFQANLLRKGSTPLAIDLSFDPGRLMGSCVGTLRDTAASASNVPLHLWKNLWSKASNPATPYQGVYNNLLMIDDSNVGDSTVPQGDGFVRMTVSSAGGVTYSGKLADGAIITGSSTLWATGETPFYQSLYANTGVVQGLIGIDGSRGVEARVDWTRKAQAKSKERNYKAGFGPLLMTLAGGLYAPPSTGAIILGMADKPGNAFVEFFDGDVESSARYEFLRQNFRISQKNAAQFSLPNVAGLSLSIQTPTGKLKGSYILRDPDTTAGTLRKVSFEGLLVPSLGVGGGFFLLNGLTPTPTTSPILSGRMALFAAP